VLGRGDEAEWEGKREILVQWKRAWLKEHSFPKLHGIP
jgi:hypothetical protein